MDFGYVLNLGAVSVALLIGALLRAKVRVLQHFLIPSSIIGGFFLLFFYNFAAPSFGMDSTVLDQLMYHLLNVSFIAMALRNPSDDKPKDGSGRKAFFQNVAAIFGQYGLQCFFGLLATLVMIVTVFPDLFPAIGLTLPLGFELGPGQAYSMTAPWEALGFEGGTSVGLAMAAAGQGRLKDNIGRGVNRYSFLPCRTHNGVLSCELGNADSCREAPASHRPCWC